LPAEALRKPGAVPKCSEGRKFARVAMVGGSIRESEDLDAESHQEITLQSLRIVPVVADRLIPCKTIWKDRPLAPWLRTT